MNELTTQKQTDSITPFSSYDSFCNAERVAQSLARSTIIPKDFRARHFQGDKEGVDPDVAVSNCMIALQLANRMKADPMMIMQNLYIIYGRPAFSAQFIIAAINTCGRFSVLKFKAVRDNNGTVIGCYAYATEKETGEVVNGPLVTLEMARSEGWTSKSGSKWKTMPEVMMRYRAASFFGRMYVPDVIMGMKTPEEVYDEIDPVEEKKQAMQAVAVERTDDVAGELNDLLNTRLPAVEAAEQQHPVVDAVEVKEESAQNSKTENLELFNE